MLVVVLVVVVGTTTRALRGERELYIEEIVGASVGSGLTVIGIILLGIGLGKYNNKWGSEKESDIALISVGSVLISAGIGTLIPTGMSVLKR